jgi:hypothetical protein
MSIEDLKARQESSFFWSDFGNQLKARIEAALPAIESQVIDQAGLELKAERSHVIGSSDEKHFSLKGGLLLKLSVAGLDTKVRLSIHNCSYKRAGAESWALHLSNLSGESRTKLDIELSDPCVPLMIIADPSWLRYIWWCDSRDDSKVAAALLDAFAERRFQSEFRLNPWPKLKQTGCLMLLSIVLTIVAAMLLLSRQPSPSMHVSVDGTACQGSM